MEQAGAPAQSDEGGHPRETNHVSQHAVRDQLERIVTSPTFRSASRICRFLRFVVDYALDGRGAELKEYLIAIEVFDKDSSYDPRSDSLVRVEGRRLRFKLRDYYAGQGKDDPVLIDISKGGYLPTFQYRRRTSLKSASRLWLYYAIVVIVLVGASALYRGRDAIFARRPAVTSLLPEGEAPGKRHGLGYGEDAGGFAHLS